MEDEDKRNVEKSNSEENNVQEDNSEVEKNNSEEGSGLMEEKHEMVSSPKIDNNPDKLLDISKLNKSIKKNPWIFISVILSVAVIVLFYIVFNRNSTENTVSQEAAGENIVEFLNVKTGGGVEYVSAEDIGNLYEITVSYQGQNLPVFVTRDGEYYIQGVIPISEVSIDSSDNSWQQQQPANVPKSDKPKVELFVMTHCPYGIQSEKGIIPTMELLGDKIDSKIRFIHYMVRDPEKEETPVQICIREEQGAKYNDYLKCFLKEGDGAGCLKETNIDETKLNICIRENSDEYYMEDSALSEGYGIQESPTLVVNGVIVNSGRDSASYLRTICSAFNEAPAECSEEISSEALNPGFGYSAVIGKASEASCS